MATRTKLVPRVLPMGDSLTWGFSASPAAGWRSSLYNFMKTVGLPIQFLGSPAFANSGPGTLGGGVLAVDPWNDGINGATIGVIWGDVGSDSSSIYYPDIIMLEGGTNDITLGADADTVIDRWSTYLDVINDWCLNSQALFLVQQIFARYDSVPLNNITTNVNSRLQTLIDTKPYKNRCTLIPCQNFAPESDYSVDKIHIEAAGVNIIGPLMGPYLVAAVNKIQALPQPTP